MKELLAQIGSEVERARSLHPRFPTAHHAYAVILEELDEVKAEVWKKQLDSALLRKELVHCAAMCIRAVLDLELNTSQS